MSNVSAGFLVFLIETALRPALWGTPKLFFLDTSKIKTEAKFAI